MELKETLPSKMRGHLFAFKATISFFAKSKQNITELVATPVTLQLKVKHGFKDFPIFRSAGLSGREEKASFYESECLLNGQGFRLRDCIIQNTLSDRQNRIGRLCNANKGKAKYSNGTNLKAERMFILQSR